MKFIYQDNQADKTIFLLHGTGADEHDLLPLVDSVRDRYNLVGLRGNVSENGMNRFFERSAPGVFNQQSIAKETATLADFLADWYKKHHLTAARTVFLGYSNGANMILATLFNYPKLISRAVLLHPMLPFAPQGLRLGGKEFLVTYGSADTMIPKIESEKVIEALRAGEARVETLSHQGGHEVRQEEIAALTKFLG